MTALHIVLALAGAMLVSFLASIAVEIIRRTTGVDLVGRAVAMVLPARFSAPTAPV